MIYMIFSKITETNCIKERYSTLESQNSTCATLRGHLSNSWAFVLHITLAAKYSWEMRLLAPLRCCWIGHAGGSVTGHTVPHTTSLTVTAASCCNSAGQNTYY